MRRPRLGTLVVGLPLLTGCAAPGPVALRHPDYRPDAIRRPAVVLQVSLEQTGFGEGEFTSRERAAIPGEFEAGMIDGLNRRGIFALDLTLVANRAWRGPATPLARLDRSPALARARSLRADALVLVDLYLGRRERIYCRESRRPFRALSTLLRVSVEVLRVEDGTRLLVEPPEAGGVLTDIEAGCGAERSVRRLSMEELAEAGVSRALTLLLGR